jgi:hypothetical protein
MIKDIIAYNADATLSDRKRTFETKFLNNPEEYAITANANGSYIDMPTNIFSDGSKFTMYFKLDNLIDQNKYILMGYHNVSNNGFIGIKVSGNHLDFWSDNVLKQCSGTLIVDTWYKLQFQVVYANIHIYIDDILILQSSNITTFVDCNKSTLGYNITGPAVDSFPLGMKFYVPDMLNNYLTNDETTSLVTGVSKSTTPLIGSLKIHGDWRSKKENDYVALGFAGSTVRLIRKSEIHLRDVVSENHINLGYGTDYDLTAVNYDSYTWNEDLSLGCLHIKRYGINNSDVVNRESYQDKSVMIFQDMLTNSPKWIKFTPYGNTGYFYGSFADTYQGKKGIFFYDQSGAGALGFLPHREECDYDPSQLIVVDFGISVIKSKLFPSYSRNLVNICNKHMVHLLNNSNKFVYKKFNVDAYKTCTMLNHPQWGVTSAYHTGFWCDTNGLPLSHISIDISAKLIRFYQFISPTNIVVTGNLTDYEYNFSNSSSVILKRTIPYTANDWHAINSMPSYRTVAVGDYSSTSDQVIYDWDDQVADVPYTAIPGGAYINAYNTGAMIADYQPSGNGFIRPYGNGVSFSRLSSSERPSFLSSNDSLPGLRNDVSFTEEFTESFSDETDGTRVYTNHDGITITNKLINKTWGYTNAEASALFKYDGASYQFRDVTILEDGVLLFENHYYGMTNSDLFMSVGDFRTETPVFSHLYIKSDDTAVTHPSIGITNQKFNHRNKEVRFYDEVTKRYYIFATKVSRDMDNLNFITLHIDLDNQQIIEEASDPVNITRIDKKGTYYDDYSLFVGTTYKGSDGKIYSIMRSLLSPKDGEETGNISATIRNPDTGVWTTLLTNIGVQSQIYLGLNSKVNVKFNPNSNKFLLPNTENARFSVDHTTTTDVLGTAAGTVYMSQFVGDELPFKIGNDYYFAGYGSQGYFIYKYTSTDIELFRTAHKYLPSAFDSTLYLYGGISGRYVYKNFYWRQSMSGSIIKLYLGAIAGEIDPPGETIFEQEFGEVLSEFTPKKNTTDFYTLHGTLIKTTR